MANFTEIDEARNILGLGEVATLKEIKKAYRTLAHRHHPDKHSKMAWLCKIEVAPLFL